MAKQSPESVPVATKDLRCEYARNPIGIDDVFPRLSWSLEGTRTGLDQTAYRIQVATSASLLQEDQPDLWDSGTVQSRESQFIEYRGQELKPRQQCYWRVMVWDEYGGVSPWSETAFWEMGLLEDGQWSADWISIDLSDENEDEEYELPPAPYFRNTFQIKGPVKSARLYVTALGLYESSINGQRVGDLVFTPGWTDYRKRLHYNVYDVTRLVHTGANAMGAILSYGWYSGYVGYAVLVKHRKLKDFYGRGAAFRCQLEVSLEDGSKQIICSDDGWKGSSGPIRKTDILMGEVYDARRNLHDCSNPEFDDSSWKSVELKKPKHGRLQAYPGVPTRVTQKLAAKSLKQSPNGGWVFDFGQNFAGVVRLQIKGEPGQEITIRHGEMLKDNGCPMTENLRKARAIDTYICEGVPEGETWVPKFTYHGFRYAEVLGLRKEPELSMLTGLVIGSDTETSGSFTTNNSLVNQIYKNIVWTQRANYLEVPTDCPQRDERLGWLGDAQIYINSASYNMNVAPFFKKWMFDVVDAQWPNGAYPNFAPKPFNRKRYRYSPAWMEAGLICPYVIYRNYGDCRILQEHYESFVRFIDFHLGKVGSKMIYHKGAFSEVTPCDGWGDWLCLERKTPKYQIANLYLGYSLKLMAEIANIIGKPQDSRFYRKKLKEFQENFTEAFVSSDQIQGETQTICAIIIMLEVLPKAVDSIARRRLLELVEETDGTMATGFIGSRFLLPALSEINRSDIAYTMLCNRDYPGWGYSVTNGATTIWERWNSYSHETGFHDPGMNSYSHYAFGAVCEWMFGYLAGIRPMEAGYKRVLLAPQVVANEEIRRVEASHRTVYGEITSRWALERGTGACIWNVELPPGTSGLVRLPVTSFDGLDVSNDCSGKRMEDLETSMPKGQLEFQLLAGAYTIRFGVPG